MVKIAFAGFRHGHINTLYKFAQENPEVEIAAAWEGDEAARKAAQEGLGVHFTHDTYESLLAEKDIDIVAIGNFYGARGRMAIDALHAGKHVYADKPLCTSLDELDEIEALAKKTGLKVGCMLDMRSYPWVEPVRAFIEQGGLGSIHAISFGGQHPLNYGVRPAWYFERGRHGGTINDIAIHGIDLIAHLTGQTLSRVIGARTWNAFATEVPSFRDSGQFMVELSGGAGLIADVSYAAPSSCGFALPYYWRFNIWGSKGVMEFNANSPDIRIALNGSEGIENLKYDVLPVDNCLTVFLQELSGKETAINTATVFRSTRDTLTIQAAAE